MWIKEKKIWSIKLFYSDVEGNKSQVDSFRYLSKFRQDYLLLII